MDSSNRIGERIVNNQGLNMNIIKYINSANIDIQFDDGYISKNKSYRHFKNGNIKNPYHLSVCDVGYIGVGKYQAKMNGKSTIQYQAWCDMLKRCYSKNAYKKFPSYKNCKVCKEWHNFQNFAKWYDENFYTISNEKMQLDKDITTKGNKTYSPNTCIFVSQSINNLFLRSNSTRGILPVGIYYHKNLKKFKAQLNKNGKRIHLGYFDTPEKAFQKYKTEKEKHIKEVADEYKGKIPDRLYNAMCKYEVEITD